MAIGRNLLQDTLSLCENGDILLCRGPMFSVDIMNFAWKFYPDIWAKGLYTHAGLFRRERFLDGNENCILSASNHVSGFKRTIKSLFGVTGYESLTHWSTQDFITIFRVENYTKEIGLKCMEFLQPYIGHSFFFSNISNSSSFYCSKLITIGWNSQGIRFKLSNFKSTVFCKSVAYCTPNSIAQSESVRKLFELK